MTVLSAEVAEALHEADICATLPPHYNDDAERAAVILAAEVRRLRARVRELADEFEAFRINNELTADQMYYRGNSVSWWWSKATAYKAAIGKVCDVAIKHGLKFNGKTDVADLLDAHLTALKP